MQAFNTTLFPAAIAGPILWQTRFIGKLNGEMAQTIPIGSRMVKEMRLSEPLAAGNRYLLAMNLFASSAEFRSVEHSA